jgi:hypothetical protein
VALSPSKLDEAADCIRRPAWQAIDPLPYEQGEAAALGSEIHQVAEDYHTHGKQPDRSTPAGKAFYPALAYVPRPLSGTAEGKFSFRVAGLEFSGLIDLACSVADLPQDWVPHTNIDGTEAPEWDPAWPVVIDYKSVKALSKDYMLNDKASFLQNRQAIVYAAKRLVETRASNLVLWWIYLRRPQWDEQKKVWTGRPKAELKYALVSLAEVTEAFGRLVVPVAKRLTIIKAEKPNPLDLPPNPDSCLRYGSKYACPRIKQCNLSVAEELSGMDLLDEMNAETAAPVTAEVAKPKKGINPPKTTKSEPIAEAYVSPTLSHNPDAELGRALRLLLAAWKSA